MDDDSDDPVMALLATQRAVLAAVENLAGQVEAMQAKVDAMGETLAQLVADSAGAAVVCGADRVPTLGDRFRAATSEEAARDPTLYAAYIAPLRLGGNVAGQPRRCPDHRIAVDGAIPNRTAAARQLRPWSIAAKTRTRKSIERAIHASLLHRHKV